MTKEEQEAGGWKEWQGENLIQMFFHCADCVKERPEDQSMEEYARINVGIVDGGVWDMVHQTQQTRCHVKASP